LSASRGAFIVVEGLDGAGTTTQTRRLESELRERGVPCILTREPTDEVVGKLIRDHLGGRSATGEVSDQPPLSEKVLSLLFAADRVHHSAAIETHRTAGTHVICDRYVHSSIAYQTLDSALSAERIIELNRGVSVPDMTLFLRVPVDACLARLEKRADTPTVYERKELLVAIERNYDESRSIYERHFGPVVEIDGSRSEDEVHAAIVRKLKNLL
jgi:dTMP kinase